MVKIGVGNTTYKRRLRRGMPCFETPGQVVITFFPSFFLRTYFCVVMEHFLQNN